MKRRIGWPVLFVAATVAVALFVFDDCRQWPPRTPVKIAAGRMWAEGDLMVLKADGSLWTLGLASEGKVQLQQFKRQHDWVDISTDLTHSLALKSDGSLWAWGVDKNGQLGDGANQPSCDHPERIGMDSDWAHVFAGGFQSFALKSNGTLWAWGSNNKGQLGLGNTQAANVPTQVGRDRDWAAVAAGLVHTLALKTDGSLWAWGQNGNGMLGDGTAGGINGTPIDSANRFAPVRIGSETGWQSISAGDNHSAGIKKDGSLWTWGSNFAGQLGDGTKKGAVVPSRVGTATDWKTVACCGNHTLAIKQNGSLWVWGYNFANQLGDGTAVDKPQPVQLGHETNWALVAGGAMCSVAMKSDGTVWFWGQCHVPSTSKMPPWLRRVAARLKISIPPPALELDQSTPMQIGKIELPAVVQPPRLKTTKPKE